MTATVKPGTPRPWFVTPYSTSNGITTCAGGRYEHRVAETCQWNRATDGKPNASAVKANAAYIVHACNSYPALAEKAEKLAMALEGLLDMWSTRSVNEARQALADYRSE